MIPRDEARVRQARAIVERGSEPSALREAARVLLESPIKQVREVGDLFELAVELSDADLPLRCCTGVVRS